MENNNTAETTTLAHQCPKCPHREPFKNAMALQMHNMRVHTRAGKQGAMWKQRPMTNEQRLAKRREEQRKLRASYYAQGLDAHGKPYRTNNRFRGPRGPRNKGRGRAKPAAQVREEKRLYNITYRERKKLGKRAERAMKRNSSLEPLLPNESAAPEIWIMQSSGVIRCPHCQKVVGEIKQQQQEQETSKWHVV